MKSLKSAKLAWSRSRDQNILIRGMRDYCKTGVALVWQRQVIFLAALALAAFYYDVWLALTILLLITVSEIYDFWTFRTILRSRDRHRATVQRNLRLLQYGTAISASVIAIYAIGLAIIDGPTTHFMSMFFLFAAGIFAAMHNHQIISLLVIRLAIYFSAFLFIPVRDIVITNASISSELWAQLFTSLFVMFFIIESARNYYKFYSVQIAQMEALRTENERTQEAYKAKTEFVSTMSHELRTPLTSIKGAVDLIHAEKLGVMPEPAKNALQIAQRNCSRLLNLINEILDIQKLESGSLQISCVELDIQKLLGEAVADNENYASSFGVTLDLELSSDSIRVSVDPGRMHQVFSNVLSNAAKFSFPGDKVQITVKRLENRVLIDFKDEGVGLSEDDADKVFDRFSQLDSSDTRRYNGTGLGMNIAKQILEAQGGSIWYSKNIGAGTTFTVELPLVN